MAAPNRPDFEGKTARGREVRTRDAARNLKQLPETRLGHAAFTIHRNDDGPVTGVFCQAGGRAMTLRDLLRVTCLMNRFGMTQAQAAVVAGLAWGVDE
jgi:hypothetical protein